MSSPETKPSFVAYVDESGDEGFVFNADDGGSSRWFVLSAVVIRQVNDLQMVSCGRERLGQILDFIRSETILRGARRN
jgi:hypothetical protein